MEFSSFAEKMNHEFRNIDIEIDKIGYKVDGQGIKFHCSCRTLKSVDYLHDCNDKLSLIEFSDLAAQHEQILRRVEKLKESNLDRSEVRRFVKDLHGTITQEMRKKYLDSLHILECMKQYFKELPTWAKDNKGRYFIIIPPIINDAPEEKKAEISRMVDTLKDNLILAIPEHLFVGVHVIQLPEFLNS